MYKIKCKYLLVIYYTCFISLIYILWYHNIYNNIIAIDTNWFNIGMKIKLTKIIICWYYWYIKDWGKIYYNQLSKFENNIFNEFILNI